MARMQTMNSQTHNIISAPAAAAKVALVAIATDFWKNIRAMVSWLYYTGIEYTIVR